MIKLTSTALIAALSAFAGITLAQDPAEPAKWDPAKASVDQITGCMARNLVNRGALRDLTLQPTDREGKSRTLKLKFFWKPTAKHEPRVNLRLMAPLAMQGSSYLLTIKGGSEEVYFYFPGADRSLKITGKNMSEPLWGTDFSYGEIKQVIGLLASGVTERKADAKVEKRAVFVLETKTSEEDTGYQKVISYVDQTACVLLKSEFFAKPSQPRKVLTADASSLLQADTYWLVLNYTMRDLREGTQTLLAMSDFSLMERMPERLFDPKRFYEPFE
jgi:hypothetical protein